jgi:hypothetical protein
VSDHILSVEIMKKVLGSLPIIRSFTNIGATWYHHPPPWSSWVIRIYLCRALHVVSAYWQSSFQLIRYLRSSQLSNLASTLLLLMVAAVAEEATVINVAVLVGMANLPQIKNGVHQERKKDN